MGPCSIFSKGGKPKKRPPPHKETKGPAHGEKKQGEKVPLRGETSLHKEKRAPTWRTDPR